MRISFQFDLEKAIRLMAYVVSRLDGADKIVLTKYLYLADRDHFLRFGYPITGDRQCAIKWGPVPSACLSVLRGEAWPNQGTVFRHLQVNDNRVTVHTPVDGALSPTELEVVEKTIQLHRNKNPRAFVREMHELPEYKEVYVPGTSRPIPYEVILKHYSQGNDAQWRKNRPVISPEMASQMNSPFGGSEPNL